MSDHLDSRAARLAAALDDFLGSSPDVEAAGVVSFDGLPMASALPDDLEEDLLGAMSAGLLSLGEQAAEGLGRGRLRQVLIEAEHGFVVLLSCRDQAVLTAVAAPSAKIGLLLHEMRRAADAVGRVLDVETGHGLDAADDLDATQEILSGPRLAAVPNAPSWTHPSTYGVRDDEPVEQALPAFAQPVPAVTLPSEPAASEPVVSDQDTPAWAAPATEDEPEPAWTEPLAGSEAALGELRAVSGAAPTTPDLTPTTPAPATPPPVSSASAYPPAEVADDEAELLAVLATDPLGRHDDHDLLTEALFEVRRATGSDDSQVPSWAQPDRAGNGWG